MRECEEGKYIPVSNASLVSGTDAVAKKEKLEDKTKAPCGTPVSSHSEQTPTVISKSQVATSVSQQKPQSLKAHVLSAAQPKVTSQQPAVKTPIQAAAFAAKPNVPLSQNLNINVSLPTSVNLTSTLSPRTQNLQKPIHIVPPQIVKTVNSSPMSPNQVLNPKQHFLQAVNKQLPMKPTTPINPKAHLLSAVNQNISSSPTALNSSLAYMKAHMPQPASVPSPVKQQVVIGKIAPSIKSNSIHVPQQILTGAVASPPLKHHIGQQPIVAGASSGRIGLPGTSPMPGISAKPMDPPKVEVSMAGCVMVPHPTVSPQAQARGQVLQAGMPVPAYEASLVSFGFSLSLCFITY